MKFRHRPGGSVKITYKTYFQLVEADWGAAAMASKVNGKWSERAPRESMGHEAHKTDVKWRCSLQSLYSLTC
jgi:hypothetical protein